MGIARAIGSGRPGRGPAALGRVASPYRRIARWAIVAGLAAASAAPAGAQIDWNNAAGGTFSDGANWVGGVAPGPADDARFALGSQTYTVDFSADRAVDDATVGADDVTFDLGGSTFTIGGLLSVGDFSIMPDPSVATVVGGTVAAGDLLASDATIVVGNGGLLEFSSNLGGGIVGPVTIRAEGDGTFRAPNFDGLGGSASLIVDDDGTIDLGNIFASNITLDSGTLRAEDLGGSVLNFNGGRFEALNDGISPAFVEGVLVQNGGTLAPGGDAEGDLRLGAGSLGEGGYEFNAGTLEIGLGGTLEEQYDSLIFPTSAGLSVLTIGAGTTLDVDLLGGFVPEVGDTFEVFVFNEMVPTTVTGDFGTLDLPGLPMGRFWDTSTLLVDGTLRVAIPEPTTLAMSAAGMLGLSGFAARRRASRRASRSAS